VTLRIDSNYLVSLYEDECQYAHVEQDEEGGEDELLPVEHLVPVLERVLHKHRCHLHKELYIDDPASIKSLPSVVVVSKLFDWDPDPTFQRALYLDSVQDPTLNILSFSINYDFKCIFMAFKA
jgi:hypothetical protein